jgi:hypothetical protein
VTQELTASRFSPARLRGCRTVAGKVPEPSQNETWGTTRIRGRASFLTVLGQQLVTVAPAIHRLFGKPSEALLSALNLLSIEQWLISNLDN